MIKFFREIRQNLLMENKTRKYFRYAIGEIVLVVIGILIALQINNWNDERKAENEIKKFYRATVFDVNEAKDALIIQSNAYKRYQDLHFLIYEQSRGEIPIDSSLVYNDLIWLHFFRPIITENHKVNFEQINNKRIQELFRDVFWREHLVVEAIEEWNVMKSETLRPFFFNNGINNVELQFNTKPYKYITSKSLELLDKKKLISHYNTREFDQILYQLKVKTAWGLECYVSLEKSYQNLKLGLQFYLEGNEEGLKSVKPLEYYLIDAEYNYKTPVQTSK